MKKFQLLIFYLILIIFPFGQLLRLNLSGVLPGLRLHLIDLAVFIFVIFSFFKLIIKKEKIKFPVFFGELLVFCCVAAFSLFIKVSKLNLSEFFGSFLYLLRLLNVTAFYLVLADLLKKNKLPVLDYLLGEGIVIAFFSLLQYLILPDVRLLFNYGWDRHYFRAIGTFLDPSFLGILLSLAFFVLIFKPVNKEKRIFFKVAGILLLLAIGLTFSRIAYLSTLVGLIIIFSSKKKIRYFFLFGLIFMAIIFLLPKPSGEGVNLLRISSFIARQNSYINSLKIIKDNFWLGVGFNSYRFAQKNYGFISLNDWQETNAGAGADNSFLFVLATTGIFGLVSYVCCLARILWFSFSRGFKNRLVDRLGENQKAKLVFAGFVSVIISSLVINSLFYVWIMVWLVILLADFTENN